MAFSDWTYQGFLSNYEAAYLYVTGGIEKPVPSAGDYGRQLASGAGGGDTALFKLTNSSFLDLPNTKAIRMQGYFLVTNSGYGFFGMSIKSSNYYGNGGYRLGFSSGPTVIFEKSNGSQTDLTSFFGSVSLNTWYGLRMEVYPIGSTADRIICYKETSPGSNSWITIYDVTLLSTDPGYSTWGSDRLMTFRSSLATNGIVDMISVTLANVP